MENLWNEYYKRPLDEIPWQHTQADWFKKLVNQKSIHGETALDLGCGTGQKSIYLSQNGFRKVTGVDISKQAIEYAKENSLKLNTQNICDFQVVDLSADWLFIVQEKQFDFILDWATIHTIPEDRLQFYTKQISQHCKKGGLLLLRAFSSKNLQINFFEESIGMARARVLVLNKDKVKELFPEFVVVAENTSQSRTKDDLFFIELLLSKKN